MQANGTTAATVDGLPVGPPAPLRVVSDPATYTCAGDTMTERTGTYTAELSRLSTTG
jgi:hypothetical protein